MGDNVDYNALFGVEPEGAGENDQQPAEADGSEKTETKAEETAEDTEEETAGGDGQGKEADGAKQVQSAEENSRYAAARRKAEAERDLAVQKAREETRAQMQAELKEQFSKLKFTNPYTKKPIEDLEGFNEYAQQYEVDRQARFAKKAGMTDTEFKEYVENLPVVKEARAKAEKAEAAQQAVREEQAKAEIEKQLGEIREMDPSINSLADLPKMENYKRFYDLVKRGNTLTDAYRLANFDKLTSKQTEQAKQAALNQVKSKSHLTQTITRGAGAVTVPADIIAAYREFNPDASMEEIRAHWASYQKK